MFEKGTPARSEFRFSRKPQNDQDKEMDENTFLCKTNIWYLDFIRLNMFKMSKYFDSLCYQVSVFYGPVEKVIMHYDVKGKINNIDLDKAAKFNVSQFPIHLHVNSNT